MKHATTSTPASNHGSRACAAIALTALALPALARSGKSQTLAGAQQPPPTPAFSIGQPPRWQPYVGGTGVLDRHGTWGPSAFIGVNRPITNPVTGLLAVTGEVYASYTGVTAGSGARLLATAPALGLGAGADWDARAGHVDFLMSVHAAVRRGGLLGHGSMLRVDWLPGRSQSIGLGFDLPIDQPLAGRTRARHTDVRLPRPDSPGAVTLAGPLAPAADSALRRVRDAADLIRAYTFLYSPRDQDML